jgi:hypothetical protein
MRPVSVLRSSENGHLGQGSPGPWRLQGHRPASGRVKEVGVRVNREAMDLPGSSDDDTGAGIGRARRARGSPRLRRQATGGRPWIIMGLLPSKYERLAGLVLKASMDRSPPRGAGHLHSLRSREVRRQRRFHLPGVTASAVSQLYLGCRRHAPLGPAEPRLARGLRIVEPLALAVAVTGTRSSSIFDRRWRPEPSWIARDGRCLGTYKLAAGSVVPLLRP